MGGGANARGGVAHGGFFGSFDQLGQGFGAHTRVDRDDVGCFGAHGQRCKVFDRVIACIGIQRGVDRKGHAVHQYGVAIGRGALDLGGGDIAACAAFVVDDEIATSEFIELLGQSARHNVGGRARRKCHQQAHGFGLGPLRCLGKTERGTQAYQGQQALATVDERHGVLQRCVCKPKIMALQPPAQAGTGLGETLG